MKAVSYDTVFIDVSLPEQARDIVERLLLIDAAFESPPPDDNCHLSDTNFNLLSQASHDTAHFSRPTRGVLTFQHAPNFRPSCFTPPRTTAAPRAPPGLK